MMALLAGLSVAQNVTQIGGALINFAKGIVRGKTETIGFDRAFSIAQGIEKQLWGAGVLKYQSDASFRESFRARAVAYISTNNPGRDWRRPYYIGQVNRHASQGGMGIADLYSFSLEGAATATSDPTGVTWRTDDVLVRVIRPWITDYENSKGIGTELSTTITKATGGTNAQQQQQPQPQQGPIQAGVTGGFGLVLVLGLLLVVGLFFASRGKAA